MKGKRSLLVGGILGAVIGWAVGYMRLPYMNNSRAFWVGAVASLAVVLLFLFLLYLWRQPTFLTRWMFKSPTQNTKGGYSIFGIIISLILAAGLSATTFLLYQQNQDLKRYQEQDIVLQQETIAIQQASLKNLKIAFMGKVMEDAQSEAELHPERKLSQVSIERVAAYGYACTPYPVEIGDGLPSLTLSPERGNILLSLAVLKLDSTTFAKIKETTSFSSTYLLDVNLAGADLSGVDLQGAYLKGANLEGANLRGADLRKADLWGANLNGADLTGAIMNQVNLQWAELKNTNLSGAILNGAVLKNAQLIKANLQNTQLQWAFCDGAMFNEADFRGADMEGTLMQRTNLSYANFSKSSLRRVDLTEANLKGAEFNLASVAEEDWLDKLITWKTINSSKVQINYLVVEDSSKRFKFGSLCLEKTRP